MQMRTWMMLDTKRLLEWEATCLRLLVLAVTQVEAWRAGGFRSWKIANLWIYNRLAIIAGVEHPMFPQCSIAVRAIYARN